MVQGNYTYQPRLLNRYHGKVVSQLTERLHIKNVMRLPKIKKIVLNMGIGDANDNSNSLKAGVEELTGRLPELVRGCFLCVDHRSVWPCVRHG